MPPARLPPAERNAAGDIARTQTQEVQLNANQIVRRDHRLTTGCYLIGTLALYCNIAASPTRRPRMEKLDRITQRREIMGGRACIRGIRVTVGMIVEQIGAGPSVHQLLSQHPYPDPDDILQSLRYAAWRAEEREVVLANA